MYITMTISFVIHMLKYNINTQMDENEKIKWKGGYKSMRGEERYLEVDRNINILFLPIDIISLLTFTLWLIYLLISYHKRDTWTSHEGTLSCISMKK